MCQYKVQEFGKLSVVLARIDDRLIHGQVCTFWVTNRGANRIIIQDTGTANDPLMSKICKQLAPRGTVVEVYTDEEAIPVLKAAFEDGDKAVWLCKFPQQVKMAVEGGVPLLLQWDPRWGYGYLILILRI